VPLRGGSAAGANRAGGVCLPLPPLTAASSVEPYFVAGGVDERAAREEAACKVLSNHRKVLPFALRGAGRVGRKRFQAPLMDPYAEPTDDPLVAAGADLLLRAACDLPPWRRRRPKP